MAEKPRTLGELIDWLHSGQPEKHQAAEAADTLFHLKRNYGDLPLIHGPERVCDECGGGCVKAGLPTPDEIAHTVPCYVCPKCHGTGTVREPVGIVSQEALEAAVCASKGVKVSVRTKAAFMQLCRDAGMSQEDADLKWWALETVIRSALTALGIEVADAGPFTIKDDWDLKEVAKALHQDSILGGRESEVLLWHKRVKRVAELEARDE